MLLEKAQSADWNAETRLAELEETIAPLATRSLGIRASSYLAPLWQSLARRLSRAPFSPDKPKLHASYASARVGRWERVVEVIEKESEWQRHPELMIRVAEAYQRLSKTSEARRAWSRLCWSHPQIAENVLSRRCDPVLTKYWKEFSGVEPELPSEDFPSWLLLADPRQRHHVPADLAPEGSPGAAYAAIHRLLGNPQDISARRIVNDHSQALLSLCLARFAKR